MKIIKRNGTKVEFNPNKILTRVKIASKGLNIEAYNVAIDAQHLIYDGISTRDIDFILSKVASGYIAKHPDYSYVASYLAVSRMHKDFNVGSVNDWLERLGKYLNEDVILRAKKWVDEIDYSYDFKYDFVGISTFINSLGISRDGVILETPVEMVLRNALFLAETKEDFIRNYNAKINYASPILTNAGTKSNTLISCSLNEVPDDSKEGIIESLNETATQSKAGSGIGKWVGILRSKDSNYGNGRGKASGIVRYCKMENEFTRYFKQHETRRGKAAIYLNIWHKDIIDFIDMKNPVGSEESTTRDLMTAILVNDLFYKRFAEKGGWSLFCPNEVRKVMGFNLYDYHSEEFEEKYLACEANEQLSRNVVSATELMTKIVSMQSKAGVPYITNIDKANNSNAQSSFGIIKTSQLCCEILNYTDHKTSGQCCLGAMPLTLFVKDNHFDIDSLIENTSTLSYNLNRVIDLHDWATERAAEGGVSQRSIAIGVAGLADIFHLLKMSFDSEEARELNSRIQEAIYYGAIKGSIEYRKKHALNLDERLLNTNLNKEGKFEHEYYDNVKTTLDWEKLRKEVLKYGVCNSNFIANMPTATSASILAINECFDPYQEIAMVRQTISGNMIVYNKYLVKELEEKGLWNDNIRDTIIREESIQKIDFGTEDKVWEKDLKLRYRTIWEIPQKSLIEMAADRQRFVDHSQSMNLYFKEPTTKILSNALYYGWKLGLKTGVYYTKVRIDNTSKKDLSVRKETVKEKPKDSMFDCFGCTA